MLTVIVIASLVGRIAGWIGKSPVSSSRNDDQLRAVRSAKACNLTASSWNSNSGSVGKGNTGASLRHCNNCQLTPLACRSQANKPTLQS
jgi:hypothetical protein